MMMVMCSDDGGDVCGVVGMETFFRRIESWSLDVNEMDGQDQFHDVPITAFRDNGLSVIATKLSSPLLLDSYTAAMCTDSCSRASYARAIIELKADVDLRETIVIVLPKFSGQGFTTSTIHVEYECAPPRCSECKVFGHVLDDCPKKIVSDISKNSKMPRQPALGPPVGLKPKFTFVYRSVFTKKAAKANGNQKVQTANKATTFILNSFDALSTLLDEDEGGGNQTPSTNATLVVTKINELERQMLDGKLVLVNEHGKSLEIKFSDDETSRYVSSTGGGGFCADDLDFYDGYEAQVYDFPEHM
ncbi:RNA-directed DNA polymerase, eukaryota [Tanacetum coccineum]